MSNEDLNTIVLFRDAASSSVSVPPLQFDAARYRAEVDAFDITEQQKQELLLTLWSIMRSFVEFGFEGDVCALLMNEHSLIPGDAELR